MNLNDWLKEWYDDHYIPTRLTRWAQVLTDLDCGIAEDRS